jgi:hypothetical protein
VANTDIFVANTSGVATVPNNDAGVQVQFNKGDRYRANHPLVKQCPTFFDPENGGNTVIEAATAAPGELRGA